MHYQQNRGDSRLDGSCAERVPSQFSGIVRPVRANQTMLIFKDKCGELE
jgi:hypothetical protein